jgi:hypothetical protein
MNRYNSNYLGVAVDERFGLGQPLLPALAALGDLAEIISNMAERTLDPRQTCVGFSVRREQLFDATIKLSGVSLAVFLEREQAFDAPVKVDMCRIKTIQPAFLHLLRCKQFPNRPLNFAEANVDICHEIFSSFYSEITVTPRYV